MRRFRASGCRRGWGRRIGSDAGGSGVPDRRGGGAGTMDERRRVRRLADGRNVGDGGIPRVPRRFVRGRRNPLDRNAGAGGVPRSGRGVCGGRSRGGCRRFRPLSLGRDDPGRRNERLGDACGRVCAGAGRRGAGAAREERAAHRRHVARAEGSAAQRRHLRHRSGRPRERSGHRRRRRAGLGGGERFAGDPPGGAGADALRRRARAAGVLWAGVHELVCAGQRLSGFRGRGQRHAPARAGCDAGHVGRARAGARRRGRVSVRRRVGAARRLLLLEFRDQHHQSGVEPSGVRAGSARPRRRRVDAEGGRAGLVENHRAQSRPLRRIPPERQLARQLVVRRPKRGDGRAGGSGRGGVQRHQRADRARRRDEREPLQLFRRGRRHGGVPARSRGQRRPGASARRRGRGPRRRRVRGAACAGAGRAGRADLGRRRERATAGQGVGDGDDERTVCGDRSGRGAVAGAGAGRGGRLVPGGDQSHRLPRGCAARLDQRGAGTGGLSRGPGTARRRGRFRGRLRSAGRRPAHSRGHSRAGAPGGDDVGGVAADAAAGGQRTLRLSRIHGHGNESSAAHAVSNLRWPVCGGRAAGGCRRRRTARRGRGPVARLLGGRTGGDDREDRSLRSGFRRRVAEPAGVRERQGGRRRQFRGVRRAVHEPGAESVRRVRPDRFGRDGDCRGARRAVRGLQRRRGRLDLLGARHERQMEFARVADGGGRRRPDERAHAVRGFALLPGGTFRSAGGEQLGRTADATTASRGRGGLGVFRPAAQWTRDGHGQRLFPANAAGTRGAAGPGDAADASVAAGRHVHAEFLRHRESAGRSRPALAGRRSGAGDEFAGAGAAGRSRAGVRCRAARRDGDDAAHGFGGALHVCGGNDAADVARVLCGDGNGGHGVLGRPGDGHAGRGEDAGDGGAGRRRSGTDLRRRAQAGGGGRDARRTRRARDLQRRDESADGGRRLRRGGRGG